MKTTLKTLLGAAALLLGTLTTTHAAGKGKGGNGGSGGGDTGGSTPVGTIYYYGELPGWGGVTPTISMSPDGSNQTVVGGDGWGTLLGNPSLNLHGTNHRWFVRSLLILDPDHVPTAEEPVKYLEYPDGSKRSHLIVLRDDYHPETNNLAYETITLLLDDEFDPTLQRLSGTHWLLDDGFVSFVARRWSSMNSDATVVGGGIYVLPLVYDADGNIIGLGELPTTPTVPLPLVPHDEPRLDGVDHPRPDIIDYAWNPTGSQFVYTKLSDPYGVWVADRDGWEIIISPDPGHSPQWSPDGQTIAYGAGGGLVTMKTNGKRKSWIIERKSFRPEDPWEFYYAKWSPDSKKLVLTGQTLGPINHDIFVVNADGSNLTNLTNTPDMREMTFGYNAGWR